MRTAPVSSTIRPASTRVQWLDSLAFTGKPDPLPGMARCLTNGVFFLQGNFPWATPRVWDYAKATAAVANGSQTFTIADIEHNPAIGYHLFPGFYGSTEAQCRAFYPRIAQLAQAMRAGKNTAQKRVGAYGLFLTDYNQTQNWSDRQARMATWRARNRFLRAGLAGVQLDFLAFDLYLRVGLKDFNWPLVVRENIAEASQMGWPLCVLLWPQYHPDGATDDTAWSYIDGERLTSTMNMLEALGVTYICMWGGHDEWQRDSNGNWVFDGQGNHVNLYQPRPWEDWRRERAYAAMCRAQGVAPLDADGLPDLSASL
jgi:hypothetical protein